MRLTQITFILILFTMMINGCYTKRDNGNKNPTGYASYTNTRYDFKIIYPNDLLIPLGESTNGDGQRFVSETDNIELIGSGMYNVAFLSLDEVFSEIKTTFSEIFNEEIKENSFYIYGVVAGKNKTLHQHIAKYYHELIDAYIEISLTYPADKKEKMMPIVKQIFNNITIHPEENKTFKEIYPEVEISE